MVIGVVGLVVGLGLGGGLLVYALDATLVRSLDQQATSSAQDVAALVDAGRVSQPLPTQQSGAIVQVIDARQRIVATSAGADQLVPMLDGADLRAARAGRHLYIPGSRAGQPYSLRVVAVRAGPHGRDTVLAAVPAGELIQSVTLLRNVLLVAYPVLVVGLAVVAWWVIGATLKPVETLRRGADRIAGSGSAADRLPVPIAADEIARLATTLNGMLARLQAGQDRQRAFVADAAHELRSPVAAIRTQLEVALRMGPAADWPEVATDVLTDTARLTRLTEDLLLLARASDAEAATERLARHRERLDLVLLCAEIAERYESARVPVTTTGDRPVWTDGDPAALGRAVANLVDNAVRHATAAVVLDATEADGRAVLAVSDDGPGIPVPDRDRVFDRFTRLDDARARDEGGSGLGLPIVAELVKLHGGTITLTAAHPYDPNTGGSGGPGVRAEIRLPLADPPTTR